MEDIIGRGQKWREWVGWIVCKIEAGATLPYRGKGGVACARVKSIIVEAMKLRGDKRSGGVENQGNGGRMMRGVAKENADSGPVLPFVV